MPHATDLAKVVGARRTDSGVKTLWRGEAVATEADAPNSDPMNREARDRKGMWDEEEKAGAIIALVRWTKYISL
jgi:hypothetical protein